MTLRYDVHIYCFRLASYSRETFCRLAARDDTEIKAILFYF